MTKGGLGMGCVEKTNPEMSAANNAVLQFTRVFSRSM